MEFDFGGFDSGFADFDLELEEFEVKKTKKFDRHWKVGEGGSVYNSPLVYGNTIYFGSADGHVYAVDLVTRKEKWRFKTSAKIFFSSPVIHDNVLYIG
ncbi:MAG: PQQ-binding-like beta-propeller repeat protein, partial [Candidatus Aenigmarchaeota archaeon]|nr:PQQ-binding-like beta-propeller repeat protein [Candidatus Aenigmarchaeota archaeon]